MNLVEFVKAAKSPHQSPSSWTQIETEFWTEHAVAINEALSPEMREHVWEEGVGLYVWRRKMLPSVRDLSIEMFDEWDDPVSDEQSRLYLDILRRVAGPRPF